MSKGGKRARRGGSKRGDARSKLRDSGSGGGGWKPSFSPPEVPSYSFPGLPLMEEVLKKARGTTTSSLASELKVSRWRVRSAIAGLKAMGMVAARRERGKYLYEANQGGSIERAYLDTYYMMLVPLTSRRSIRWVAKTFWSEDKEGTALKRASYLLRMGSELGLLKGSTLTESGLREVIARAVEDIYFGETGGKTGKFLTLTKVLDALKEWGADMKVVRAHLLGSLALLDGNLFPAPNLSERVRKDGIKGKSGYLYYLSLKGRKFPWTTPPTG